MTVDIVLVFDDPDSLCSTYFLLVDMWFLPSIISFARNSFWLVDRCPQPHQQCHHQNNVVVTFSRCEYITQSAPSTKATNLKQKNTISTHANCDPARRFSVFSLSIVVRKRTATAVGTPSPMHVTSHIMFVLRPCFRLICATAYDVHAMYAVLVVSQN